MARMPISMPMMEREDRADIDSAFDPNPASYGPALDPDQQAVSGGTSFAELRDEMNTRRRRTARRMMDGGC